MITESDLRDTLAYHAGDVLPEDEPYRRLLDRRVRRNRRRAVVGAAAGLAVVALAVPAALDVLPTGTPPATERQPTGPAIAAKLIDREHGFVAYDLSGEAPRTGGTWDCGRALVRVTEDGGRTWSEPRGPADVPCPEVEEVEGGVGYEGGPWYGMLDADTLLFRFGDHTRISHDAGRTWQPHQLRTTAVDALPEGVSPELCVAGQGCEAGLPHLEAYDPATGNRWRLRTDTGLTQLRQVTVGPDGRFWVTGETGDGRRGVAVSADRGRTWNATPVTDFGNALSIAVAGGAAGADGTVAYAVATDAAAESTTRLFRTNDGGQTWDRVPGTGLPGEFAPYLRHQTPEGTVEQFEPELYVALDGTVVIGGIRRWYASTDGGQTFAVTDTLPKDAVATVDAGPGRPYQSLWGPFEQAAGTLWVSDDGLSWRRVAIP